MEGEGGVEGSQARALSPLELHAGAPGPPVLCCKVLGLPVSRALGLLLPRPLGSSPSQACWLLSEPPEWQTVLLPIKIRAQGRC